MPIHSASSSAADRSFRSFPIFPSSFSCSFSTHLYQQQQQQLLIVYACLRRVHLATTTTTTTTAAASALLQYYAIVIYSFLLLLLSLILLLNFRSTQQSSANSPLPSPQPPILPTTVRFGPFCVGASSYEHYSLSCSHPQPQPQLSSHCAAPSAFLCKPSVHIFISRAACKFSFFLHFFILPASSALDGRRSLISKRRGRGKSRSRAPSVPIPPSHCILFCFCCARTWLAAILPETAAAEEEESSTSNSRRHRQPSPLPAIVISLCCSAKQQQQHQRWQHSWQIISKAQSSTASSAHLMTKVASTASVLCASHQSPPISVHQCLC